MVSLLFGTEAFLVDEKLKELLSGIELPEMNVQKFDGQCETSELEEACFTEPFFSEKRAVVLRNPQMKPDALKKLSERVPESTHLIVVADKIDKRSVVYKHLKDSCFELNKPGRQEAVTAVLRIAKSEGVVMQRETAEEILARLGYHEEDGMSLYAALGVIRQLSQDGRISTETVRAMLPESAAGKAWQLFSMVCRGKNKEAFSLLSYLLDAGESEVGILSMLLRGFRMAWKEKARIAREENLRYQYAEALKYPVCVLNSVQEAIEDAVDGIKSGDCREARAKAVLAKVIQLLEKEGVPAA